MSAGDFWPSNNFCFIAPTPMTFGRMEFRSVFLLCVIFSALVVSTFDEIDGSSSEPAENFEKKEKENGSNISNHGNSTEEERFYVAVVDFANVADPFIIALWIIFASLAKMGFHLYNKLSSIFPESCLLILLGVLVGLILYFSNILPPGHYFLNSKTFFLFLLPPIVFEAGYSMPGRAFFDNLGTILVYAVVGTLFNTIMIGVSLWAVSGGVLAWTGVELSLLTCLVFSSLISAVDPVAVLAVFEEIHVNEILFIIVFGESLLNDAVTVVLYHMFESFAHISQHGRLLAVDYLAGAASFLVVSLGGTCIGLLYGLLTSLITKYTDHVRAIEPVFVFMMAYLAYLSAEIFHLSGILAIVFCGVLMKRYVQANFSQDSVTTVSYLMKMMSSVSETVIFMFLGLSTVTDMHELRLWFVSLTLLFCFLYRVIGIVIFSRVANCFRMVKLSGVDQFVMAYGGLRGAIAFSLAALLPESIIPEKRMLVTTTIVVIYFTVFVQGVTIKPLVNLLHVKKDDKHEISMNERIHTRLIDHLSAGMEDITGHFGHHRLRDSFNILTTKYLEPLLLREKPKCPGEMAIYRTFSALNLKDAVEYISRHGSFLPQHLEPESVSQAIRRASLSVNQWCQTALDLVLLLCMLDGDHDTERHLSVGQPRDPPARHDTILDMQALDVNYSRKMDDDVRCHHIVEQNMILPRKAVSREMFKFLLNVTKLVSDKSISKLLNVVKCFLGRAPRAE